MNEQEMNDIVLEELEDIEADKSAESQEESMMNQQDWQEAYGSPQSEEVINPARFLHRAAFESEDTLRTTHLNEYELGRPLFSVRFLLDLEDVCKHYIDPLCIALGLKPEEHNKVSKYFKEKIKNVSDSGMSKEGFIAQLNVTKKIESTRSRIKNLDPEHTSKS